MGRKFKVDDRVVVNDTVGMGIYRGKRGIIKDYAFPGSYWVQLDDNGLLWFDTRELDKA